MEILFLLVPFITSVIMQSIKKLAGLAASYNSPEEKAWLRTVPHRGVVLWCGRIVRAQWHLARREHSQRCREDAPCNRLERPTLSLVLQDRQKLILPAALGQQEPPLEGALAHPGES